MKIRDRYKLNKKANIGDKLTCPSCGSEFEKTHYAQAFCKSKSGTKCKDKYWNTVDPNKRNNTTRISPASAAWLDRMGNIDREIDSQNIYDDMHPFEGLNDDEYKNF